MKKALGTILMIVGIGIIAYGLIGALREINDLYQQATTDALAQPDVAEEDRPDRILRHVGIAAVGVPFLLVGSVLSTRSKIRRLHRMMRG